MKNFMCLSEAEAIRFYPHLFVLQFNLTYLLVYCIIVSQSFLSFNLFVFLPSPFYFEHLTFNIQDLDHLARL